MKGDSCEAVSGGNWSNERGPCLLSLFIGLLLRRMLRVAFGVEDGGGGCKQQIFIRGGRLRPKVQPLTLLYTIFDRKGTFRIPHINKRYPFTCIVSNFAYLLTVVNALF